MGEGPRPRLLLLGAQGQVGGELTRTLPPLGDLTALDRASADLSEAAAIRAAVRAHAPDVIVNAAAYTEVDRAETEPDAAHRINGTAPGVLAAEAARGGALLVHYSTDYVFDGTCSRPYTERDAPGPRTTYGASKLAGDEAVLASEADAYILRVGWVYGRRGRNFLNTMLRLAGERDELRVVADQHGGPTWSRAIAETTSVAVGKWLTARRLGGAAPPRGVYHLAPPDSTTWHGFATAIVQAMTPPDGRTRPRVTAITSAEFPTLATRPAWSVLDGSLLRETFGLELPPWRTQLELCLGGP
jgi:dTDP-4-dehydrorhamnose reductase